MLSKEEEKKLAEMAAKESKSELDYWANILAVLTPDQRYVKFVKVDYSIWSNKYY